jgi:hypothetical protein
MNRTITACGLLVLTLSGASASATPKKAPFWGTEGERETELSLRTWDTPAVIERKRSFGRKSAVFHADPQAIAADAVLIFEIESEGEVRWRCVAVDDVAECLGAPVRVRYQKAEEIVRLKVTAVPRESDRGDELVVEAKRSRELRFVANR